MTVSKSNKVVPIRAVEEDESTANGESAQLVPTTEQTDDKQTLDYQVLHQMPGRIRLRVNNLRYDSQHASACILQISSLKGILEVRTNYWCASTIIEYDPIVVSAEAVLERLDQLAYDAHELIVPSQRKHGESLPVRLLRKVLTILDHSLPAGLQLGFGIAAFAAGVLEFPVFATK